MLFATPQPSLATTGMELATRAQDVIEPSALIPGGRSEWQGELALAHSGAAPVTVRFELAGHSQAPLLVVAGGISAGRHVLANSADETAGWWEAQSSTLCDFRVLAIDWLGSDGTLDLAIDPADQAAAIIATLDRLGIGKAVAFIGSSYGAMVGMHAAIRSPGRFGALLAFCGASRPHPHVSAGRSIQRQIIALAERLGDPAAGVALARKAAVLSYRSEEEFGGRFTDRNSVAAGKVRCSAEPYLDAMGERHRQRMSAAAYRRLSESIDLHFVDPRKIAIPATFVAVPGDRIIPFGQVERDSAEAPDGCFLTLPSRFGHDGFLKETEGVAAIITDFLSARS